MNGGLFYGKLVAFLFSLQVIILLALVSCSSPLRNQRESIVIDTVVQCDAHLTVGNDSPVARSVHTNNTDLLGEMAAVYGFNAKLNDLFKDKTLPVSLLPETFPDMSIEEVPAAPVFDKYVKEGNWSAVESFLAYLDYPMSLADLKREAAKLPIHLPGRNIARASGVVDHYTTTLKDNLGKTLVDGAVLLECSHKKAYYGFGTYAHGGIFSRKRFEEGDGSDAAHCVYTAQPDEYQGFPQDMMPDRPGYACLDTLFMVVKDLYMANLCGYRRFD